MGMAMDPEVGLGHQIRSAGDEAGRDDVVRIACVEAAEVGAVMGDHHGLAVERLRQRIGQPGRGRAMASQCIGRRERAVLAVGICGSDQAMIKHHARARLHGFVDTIDAIEAVVGPPRGADHAHALAVGVLELGDALAKKRDVAGFSGRVRHLPAHRIEGALVVLVIARHVEHGPVEHARRPVDAVAAVGDVSGQDREVRATGGDLLGHVVFDVQIAQDADLHAAAPGCPYGQGWGMGLPRIFQKTGARVKPPAGTLTRRRRRMQKSPDTVRARLSTWCCTRARQPGEPLWQGAARANVSWCRSWLAATRGRSG